MTCDFTMEDETVDSALVEKLLASKNLLEIKDLVTYICEERHYDFQHKSEDRSMLESTYLALRLAIKRDEINEYLDMIRAMESEPVVGSEKSITELLDDFHAGLKSKSKR